MRNAYRERDAEDNRVPHSFLFRRREDLSAAHLRLIEGQRMPYGIEPNPADVFCLVKQFMSDENYCQDPILVWPKNDLGKTSLFWNAARRHEGVRGAVDATRAQALSELADALRAYPQYSRAIAYLEQLAGIRARVWAGVPKLIFLDQPVISLRNNMRGGSLPEREPAPAPHRLEVRFHRRWSHVHMGELRAENCLLFC